VKVSLDCSLSKDVDKFRNMELARYEGMECYPFTRQILIVVAAVRDQKARKIDRGFEVQFLDLVSATSTSASGSRSANNSLVRRCVAGGPR
jgi:primosomal protein N'